MKQKDIEQASDIILNSIMTSDLEHIKSKGGIR